MIPMKERLSICSRAMPCCDDVTNYTRLDDSVVSHCWLSLDSASIPPIIHSFHSISSIHPVYPIHDFTFLNQTPLTYSIHLAAPLQCHAFTTLEFICWFPNQDPFHWPPQTLPSYHPTLPKSPGSKESGLMMCNTCLAPKNVPHGASMLQGSGQITPIHKGRMRDKHEVIMESFLIGCLNSKADSSIYLSISLVDIGRIFTLWLPTKWPPNHWHRKLNTPRRCNRQVGIQSFPDRRKGQEKKITQHVVQNGLTMVLCLGATNWQFCINTP